MRGRAKSESHCRSLRRAAYRRQALKAALRNALSQLLVALSQEQMLGMDTKALGTEVLQLAAEYGLITVVTR